MLRTPPRLSLAQLPTPIQALQRLTVAQANTKIWIKRDDLTGCATSGNKVRKLEFTLAEARQQGTDVIITCGGVQSNHARATAILGAQLGLKVHLLLRGEESELSGKGNHFLDQLAGATIDCYPSSIYVPQFHQLVDKYCEHYRQQGLKPYFITTGASDATGVWGYLHACEEILAQSAQMDVHFDHIVCAVGSGGTLAGLVAGEKIHGLNSQIWGINVCDTAEVFQHKARQDLRDWQHKYSADLDISLDVEQLSVQVLDGYVGAGYAKADRPVYELILQLARKEGILLDPTYTGKAFFGLLAELQKGRFAPARAGEECNILFIHTGGLFGLLADEKMHAIMASASSAV
jgi:D-cysteine desulfhydrase